MECESYKHLSHSPIIILSFFHLPGAARWECNKGNSFYFFFVEQRLLRWRRRHRKDEAVVHDEKETVEGGRRINIFLLDGYELQAIRKKIIVPKDENCLLLIFFFSYQLLLLLQGMSNGRWNLFNLLHFNCNFLLKLNVNILPDIKWVAFHPLLKSLLILSL